MNIERVIINFNGLSQTNYNNEDLEWEFLPKKLQNIQKIKNNLYPKKYAVAACIYITA